MTDTEEELVGQPTDEVPKRDPDGECNGKRWEKRDGETVFVGYCGLAEAWGRDDSSGRCKYHHNGDHGGGGAPEGNDNAVTHGAFREFFTRSLTEAETTMVKQAEELLEDDASAQRVGRMAASLCLVQYDRGGDERFMRRFESICDKFGITPDEQIKHDHEHTGTVTQEITFSLSDDQLEALDEYY